MKLKMTIDEALEIVDESSRGITVHVNSTGLSIAAMLLAEEVRRLRSLANDLRAIAKTGTTPDGDEVNVPTLLWAEKWAKSLHDHD